MPGKIFWTSAWIAAVLLAVDIPDSRSAPVRGAAESLSDDPPPAPPADDSDDAASLPSTPFAAPAPLVPDSPPRLAPAPAPVISAAPKIERAPPRIDSTPRVLPGAIGPADDGLKPALEEPTAKAPAAEDPKPLDRSTTAKDASAANVPDKKTDPAEPRTLPTFEPPPETTVEIEQLPSELQALRTKVRRTLAAYHPARLNSRDHNTWEVMHAIIAYGVESQMRRDAPNGGVVNSIGWLCYNYPCNNQQLLTLENNRVAAKKGVGVQGHAGQFLAILAQSHVKTDYPMMVQNRKFTIADLIESEKYDCQAGTELTFKLISMAHYLDLNETWKNYAGETWSVPRLIQEEIRAPINGAACGGTHRLMGLSYAVKKRLSRGEPIDGEYRRAKIYTDDYHRYTLKLQNSDGSFSTEWFTGPGARPDLGRRIQTSGHILEWLVFSLPPEELTDPRVTKAVNYLSTIMLEGRQKDWEIGPLGHAIHALVMYDERMFKPYDSDATPVARNSKSGPSLLSPVPTMKATVSPSERPVETIVQRPKLMPANDAPLRR